MRTVATIKAPRERLKEAFNAPVVAPAWMVATGNSIRHVLEVVGDTWGVDAIDMLSGRYTDAINEARAVAYWILSRTTDLSSQEIAIRMGRKDHTTALHSVKAIEAKREADARFRRKTNAALDRAIGKKRATNGYGAVQPTDISLRPPRQGYGYSYLLSA